MTRSAFTESIGTEPREMCVMLPESRCFSRAFVLLTTVVLLTPVRLCAFQTAPVAKTDAALVVDGVVREVFRSPRAGQVDYLVQIEVNRAEIGRLPSAGPRPPMPAPSESVYVHVFQGPNGHRMVPSERALIRAYLTPRAKGGWEGTFPDWYEATADRLAGAGPNDPAPPLADSAPPPRGIPAPEPDQAPNRTPESTGGRTAIASLGATVETLSAQGHRVLRITAVERGGAGQKAGLEVGDIIAGVNGKAITGADQIEQAARQGGTLALVVVDVNTGKGVRVDVALGSAGGGGLSAPTEPGARPAAPDASTPSIGLSAEPITLGQRTAMQVVRIEPDSPAQKAGFEVGDVIIAAGGVPITGAEQLSAALRKSGPTLVLSVRDTRTGREVPVEVQIPGRSGDPGPLRFPVPSPGASQPVPGPNSGGSRDRLGAVTEITLYQVEAAVKVTEVAPGSPADRAGLKPGLIILTVNGKLMLHPNELAEAVRQSPRTLQLSVVDPRSGRKANISVDLGG
jgi:S1-C subfamily serine protease